MLRLLDRIVEAAAALCLVASTLMIIVNVIYRYVVLGWLRTAARETEALQPVYRFFDDWLGAVSVTADEAPGLLLVWIAFLGGYLALRDGRHIAFTMLVDDLRGRWRQGATALGLLLSIGFFAMLLHQSIRMIRIDGATEIETAEIAQGWFMAILPIASVLFITAFTVQLVAALRRPRDADPDAT